MKKAISLNNWFWAVISKEGKVLKEGKIEGCISCHSPLKYNDYIITYQLDKPLE